MGICSLDGMRGLDGMCGLDATCGLYSRRSGGLELRDGMRIRSFFNANFNALAAFFLDSDRESTILGIFLCLPLVPPYALVVYLVFLLNSAPFIFTVSFLSFTEIFDDCDVTTKHFLKIESFRVLS